MTLPPQDRAGRLLAMVLLVAGVGLAGLFTASVASILVERYLRRRDVSNFEMDDHLVLCNWAPRGLEWIREVHSKIIQNKRPVVIIHDEPDEIDLPDKQDDPAFNDVYIVKGDPTNEVILRRAKVPKAHSVVILSDDRQGSYADGKSILTCIAIRDICRGGTAQHRRRVPEPEQPPPPAQGGRQRGHLVGRAGPAAAGADGPVPRHVPRLPGAADRRSRRQRDLPVPGSPRSWSAADFIELSEHVPPLPRRPPLLPAIGIQRGEEMILNPIGDEAGPLQAGRPAHPPQPDLPSGEQPLPISPPVASLREEKGSK